MRGYCPTCNSTEELAIINKKETYPVKGEKITIDARVAVCKACGTEVFVGEIEFENLENAYRIYRDRHGIVPAEEIRSLRKKTGLSQREFAKRLGWSPATVNRRDHHSVRILPANALVVGYPRPTRLLVSLCFNIAG